MRRGAGLDGAGSGGGRYTDAAFTYLDDPGIVFALVALVVARARSRGTTRTVRTLFAVGIASWLTGEIVFELHAAAGGGTGASLADLFYLLFYPPVMVGLYRLAGHDHSTRTRAQSLDIVIVMSAAALLLWLLIRETTLGATGSALTQGVDVAYAALDLGLLWLLLFPAMRSDTRWTRARTWMAVAFSGFLVADVIDVNESAARLTGLSRAELLRSSVTDFVPDQDPHLLERVIERMQHEVHGHQRVRDRRRPPPPVGAHERRRLRARTPPLDRARRHRSRDDHAHRLNRGRPAPNVRPAPDRSRVVCREPG